MGKIVAYGGGEWERIRPINRLILGLSGRSRPNVLFIPTASKDNPDSITRFTKVYSRLGADVDLLLCIRETSSPSQIKRKFRWADVIFIGGGNTLMMMRRWKFLGVDAQIRKAYRDGTVLAGASAGSICWFESGHSDSMRGYGHDPWDYIQVSGFGFIKGFHCPHYHYPKDDREAKFQQMILQRGGHGIAMDDGAGIVVVDGQYRVIHALPGAKVYSVRRCRGQIVQVEIPRSKIFQPIADMYTF